MTATVDSKVAIVTGATGGLGSAVCERLRRGDIQVLGVDIQGKNAFHADVATAEGNRAMIEHAMTKFGRIDILVLNAGVQFMSPISDFPLEKWDYLMDVMVKGPFLAIKYAWRELTRAPGRRVVVTASGSSFIAEAYKSAYVAAKHAVVGLVKTAALEGGTAGLTVNAVAPGWMRTPLVEKQLADQMRLHGKSRDEVTEQMVQRHPVKRFVEPMEVANTIVFLASDEASGINGACLPVDLGTLAW
jgi:3-hydroxybutyrate dehydrogenase